MSNFRGLFCLIAVLLAASMQPSARAQDDANFDVGLAPFGSYHGGNIDQVALANGSLNVQIPLISYPQRGGKLKMDFVLEYVNRSGDENTECDDYGDCWALYGATIPQFYIVDKDEIGLSPGPSSGGCAWDGGYSNYCQFYVPDASGANHLIAPTFGSGSYGSGPWRSVDATGIKASASYGGISLPIIDSAGTSYTADCPGTLITDAGDSYLPSFVEMAREDSNGNEISCSSSSVTDSMGRTIPLPTESESSGDFTGCPTSGAQATQLVLLWNPPGINGGEYQMKFCYYYDTSETFLGSDSPVIGYVPLLSRIVLLNNSTAWNFTYTSDTLDNLAQVTLPTGGTVSYAWYDTIDSDSPGACPDGNDFDYNATINTRTLDPSDGVDPSETWTYYLGRVTDPAGNDTVHTFFGACYPYETETQYYKGLSTVGSPVVLKTVATTNSYNYGYSWVDSVYNPNVILNVVPSTVSTTLNDTSQESEAVYTYDSEFTYHRPLFNSYTGDIISGTSYTNGTYGLKLTEQDWDWGGSTDLRTTTNTYLALSNSTYLSANLLDLLSSVKITGSCTATPQCAYSTYNYDESGSPSGAHGNRTSIHRWLNTTGGYLVTSSVYNSNGLVTSTTDPNSDTTDRPEFLYQFE